MPYVTGTAHPSASKRFSVLPTIPFASHGGQEFPRHQRNAAGKALCPADRGARSAVRAAAGGGAAPPRRDPAAHRTAFRRATAALRRRHPNDGNRSVGRPCRSTAARGCFQLSAIPSFYRWQCPCATRAVISIPFPPARRHFMAAMAALYFCGRAWLKLERKVVAEPKDLTFYLSGDGTDW